MENSPDTSSASAPEIGPDLKHLKNSTSASVEELREFMRKFKGRKPQEVMGQVAQSDLIRSIGVASGGIVALILVLTIIPYSLSSSTPKNGASTASRQQAAAPVAPATENSSAETAAAADTAPDLERAAKAMKLDETQTADPNTNPLDDKFDKLLDDPD